MWKPPFYPLNINRRSGRRACNKVDYTSVNVTYAGHNRSGPDDVGAYSIREKLAAYVARMLRIAPVAGVIPRYLPDVLKGQLGPEFF